MTEISSISFERWVCCSCSGLAKKERNFTVGSKRFHVIFFTCLAPYSFFHNEIASFVCDVIKSCNTNCSDWTRPYTHFPFCLIPNKISGEWCCGHAGSLHYKKKLCFPTLQIYNIASVITKNSNIIGTAAVIFISALFNDVLNNSVHAALNFRIISE
jgi:hypothetical protein